MVDNTEGTAAVDPIAALKASCTVKYSVSIRQTGGGYVLQGSRWWVNANGGSELQETDEGVAADMAAGLTSIQKFLETGAF